MYGIHEVDDLGFSRHYLLFQKLILLLLVCLQNLSQSSASSFEIHSSLERRRHWSCHEDWRWIEERAYLPRPIIQSPDRLYSIWYSTSLLLLFSLDPDLVSEIQNIHDNENATFPEKLHFLYNKYRISNKPENKTVLEHLILFITVLLYQGKTHRFLLTF